MLTALLLFASTAGAAEPWSAVINPDNSLSFSFLCADRPVFDVGLGGWGPKWAWVGVAAHEKADGKRLSVRTPFVVNKDKGEVIDVRFEAWHPAARQVAFRYDAERGRHFLLHLRKGVQRLPDVSQAFPGPVRGVAEGPLRLTGEVADGLGGSPES
jgi:hypothetical protein